MVSLSTQFLLLDICLKHSKVRYNNHLVIIFLQEFLVKHEDFLINLYGASDGMIELLFKHYKVSSRLYVRPES